VFGCAGETDKGKRPILTKIATEKSDVAILTTGNPKSENQCMYLAVIFFFYYKGFIGYSTVVS